MQTAKRNTTHGLSGTSTYYVWHAMVSRTTNPHDCNYSRYGAKGIGICERWLSYQNFLSDMGQAPDGLSIDRIDNTKGYSPENCRWATIEQQAFNRALRKDNRHGIPGVTLDKRTGKWIARLALHGRQILNRAFDDFHDAVAARRQAEDEYVAPLFPGSVKIVNSDGSVTWKR